MDSIYYKLGQLSRTYLEFAEHCENAILENNAHSQTYLTSLITRASAYREFSLVLDAVLQEENNNGNESETA